MRLLEVDAVGAHLLRLGDNSRGVQQGLRGDATDIQADAAEALIALDEDRLEPEVGGAERGRVAAGARAEHEHLRIVFGVAWG